MGWYPHAALDLADHPGPSLLPPGGTETACAEGLSTTWLEEAAADFAGFVERRRPSGSCGGVPVTELWFVDGTDHLGTVIIRHRLTPALEREGGHIVPRHRRRGHATQMLAQAKPVCQRLGLTRILVTCAEDNLGSRRVIEANGGTLDRIIDGEARYWLPAQQDTRARCGSSSMLAFRSVRQGNHCVQSHLMADGPVEPAMSSIYRDRTAEQPLRR